MREHDFCNPHQLVRNDYKMNIRIEFLRKLFSLTKIYVLNTAVESPVESRNRLYKMVKENIGCEVN